MSTTTLNKEVAAIVCDKCDLEIEKKEDYCYHSMVEKLTDEEPIKSYKFNVKHFLFSWWHHGKKKNADSAYVRYDFHPACIDEIIEKFLKEKSNEK